MIRLSAERRSESPTRPAPSGPKSTTMGSYGSQHGAQASKIQQGKSHSSKGGTRRSEHQMSVIAGTD